MKKKLFHDAELVAVEHIRHTETLILKFQLSGNEIERVTLGRVQSFRMTDFIGQNVVFRVLDSKIDRMSDNAISERLRWLYQLSDGTLRVDDNAIEKSRADVIAGTLRLFCIEPSWGAELICLYRDEN